MGRRLKRKVSEEIGSRILLLRLKNGLSQSELGKRIGVSYQQIQKYEKGTNTISSARMQILCSVLHCTPSDLIRTTESESTILSNHAIRTAIRIERLKPPQQVALNKIIDALENK